MGMGKAQDFRMIGLVGSSLCLEEVERSAGLWDLRIYGIWDLAGVL